MKEHHAKHGGGHKSEAAPAVLPAETQSPESESKVSEAEALKEQLLRLRADFDNFRRRTLREQNEAALRANEGLMSELLPVLDHFSLGLQSALQNESGAPVVEGFQLVYDQFITALIKFGLAPFDAVEGQPFDPALHESIGYARSDSVQAECVLAQTRKGFKLGDKLLRAAQVVVSQGAGESAPVEGAAEPGEVNEAQPV